MIQDSFQLNMTGSFHNNTGLDSIMQGLAGNSSQLSTQRMNKSMQDKG